MSNVDTSLAMVVRIFNSARGLPIQPYGPETRGHDPVSSEKGPLQIMCRGYQRHTCGKGRESTLLFNHCRSTIPTLWDELLRFFIDIFACDSCEKINQKIDEYEFQEKHLLLPSTYWGHITVVFPGIYVSPTVSPSGGVFLCSAVGTGGCRRCVSLITAFRWLKLAIFSFRNSPDDPMNGASSSLNRAT